MNYLFAITFITICSFSFVYNLGEEKAKNDRFLMNNDFVVTKELVWPKSNSNDTKYSWIETDSSVALLLNSKIIWQLNHTSLNGKPYFYPLNTTKGHNLVWLRPDDHPWHIRNICVTAYADALPMHLKRYSQGVWPFALLVSIILVTRHVKI